MEEVIEWFVDTSPDYDQLLTLLNTNYGLHIESTVNPGDHSTRYFDNTIEIIPAHEITYFYTRSISKKFLHVTEEPFEIEKEDTECCVCLETKTTSEFCELNCEHKFCCKCIEKILQKKSQQSLETLEPLIHSCPLCRRQMEKIIVQTKECKESMEKFI